MKIVAAHCRCARATGGALSQTLQWVPLRMMTVVNRAGNALEGKLGRSMTAHEVVGGYLFLRRRLHSADGLRILAPGMEMTTRRWFGRIGYFALEDDAI